MLEIIACLEDKYLKDYGSSGSGLRASRGCEIGEGLLTILYLTVAYNFETKNINIRNVGIS